MNNSTQICIAALSCVTLIPLACIPPPGQRLLTVQIEADGNVVYEGIRGVPDRTPVVSMWDILGDVPLEPTAPESHDPVDEDTVARTLEAEIVVRIKHVNNELASASLRDLTLRTKNNGASWSLDAAEVARIKQAAKE